MLINFCEKRVKSVVKCSAISNDGYEVTNLIEDSNKGFLAYSCIKPPIHIDFTLVCDIRLSRVLIWPRVGAQKSSGFEISVKSSSESEYKRVSTAFLDPSHSGVSFYRRDVHENGDFGDDPTFLRRYIRVSDSRAVNNVRNLRISILRTENSVPAIGSVQIWGRVSHSCDKKTVSNVHGLWKGNDVPLTKLEPKNVQSSSENAAEKIGNPVEDQALNVPESFLDPITWSIMIQPIVLPSGVTIDQSTLEKHAKTEATWGRGLSDPFTGIPFSESRKPVLASALKARIDKFLLDNKHAPDVKSLPRLSGYKQVLASLRNRPVELSEFTGEFGAAKSASNLESTKSHDDKLENRKLARSAVCEATRASRPKFSGETRIHRLPVIPMCSSRVVAKKNLKTPKIKAAVSLAIKKEIRRNADAETRLAAAGSKVETNLDHSVQNVLSNLQRFDEEEQRTASRQCLENCNCSSRIFYKLPCNHVLCKDVLMAAKNSRCAICWKNYSSRDPERVHEPSRLD